MLVENFACLGRASVRTEVPSAQELVNLHEYFSRRDGRARIPMLDILWFAIGSRGAKLRFVACNGPITTHCDQAACPGARPSRRTRVISHCCRSIYIN